MMGSMRPGGSDGDNWDSFRADGSHFVRITGGTLWVDAQGDGLDSNGGLYLDGGTVLISGPTGNGNGALDYDGECLVTGGVLLAAGSSGMAQGPSASSNQNSLMITFLESQAAGTLVNLSDSQGRSILTFAPSKAFQSWSSAVLNWFRGRNIPSPPAAAVRMAKMATTARASIQAAPSCVKSPYPTP